MVFVNNGLEVVDTTTNTVIDFTLGNLRKNIFDILEEKIGADKANKVLGHGATGDVGLDYYKVERALHLKVVVKKDFLKLLRRENFYGVIF